MITPSDYPAISSPAACPKCGSMDLRTPFHGQRTRLWLSTCRDCSTDVRSREYFTVLPRKQFSALLTQPKSAHEPRPDDNFGATLNEIRMRAMKTMNLPTEKPRMREIGEEG